MKYLILIVPLFLIGCGKYKCLEFYPPQIFTVELYSESTTKYHVPQCKTYKWMIP